VAQQQLAVFGPDLEPGEQPGKPFVAVCAYHGPGKCAVVTYVELGLDDVEVDAQLPVELRFQSMLDDFVGNTGEDGQHRAHR